MEFIEEENNLKEAKNNISYDNTPPKFFHKNEAINWIRNIIEQNISGNINSGNHWNNNIIYKINNLVLFQIIQTLIKKKE